MLLVQEDAPEDGRVRVPPWGALPPLPQEALQAQVDAAAEAEKEGV